MRNDRLIELLQTYPPEIDVCVNAQVGDELVTIDGVTRVSAVVNCYLPSGVPFAYVEESSVEQVATSRPSVDILYISF